MVDVLLSSENIDVLGGSPRVDVNLNFGRIGERGSYIFVGSGNPNLPTAVIPQTPKNFDMYINLAPDDDEYLFLYQYLNQSGTFLWVRLLRLVPNTFLQNFGDDPGETNFVDGEMIYNLPITTVIPLATVGVYQASNFNIQHSIIYNQPVASSIIVGDIAFINDTLILPVTVKAVTLDPSTGVWSNLDGPAVVHFLTTVV
jgi:hypothetical protein